RALLAVAAGVLATRPWNRPQPQADFGASGAPSPTPAVAPGPARLTAAELARLPSPLDAVNREIAGWRTDAPADVLAVLDRTRFAVPRRDLAHWMTLSPDRQLLAVPSGNDVILFDARTGLPRRTLTGHTSPAFRPAFSPDGRRLVSGSAERLL